MSFCFRFGFTFFLLLLVDASHSPHYRTNFTGYCNKKLTCLEFFDCCRWFTGALCPGPTYEHCSTGINGKPIERNLQCGCDQRHAAESISSPSTFSIDDLPQRSSFNDQDKKETIISSCRTLMSVLSASKEPCRVFASCCDILLGDCISPRTGRQGRKSVYCSPQSARDSFCECLPHDRDRSIFDLRPPANGVGSLTAPCADDSYSCHEFAYCCQGYLDSCPGKKRLICAPNENGEFDKTSALCECEFNAAVNVNAMRNIALIFLSYIFFLVNII